MSETFIRETTAPTATSGLQQLAASTYVATTAEALNNWHQNHANRWYTEERIGIMLPANMLDNT